MTEIHKTTITAWKEHNAVTAGKIIHVAEQSGTICVWLEEGPTRFDIVAVPTGGEVPAKGEHISTSVGTLGTYYVTHYYAVKL